MSSSVRRPSPATVISTIALLVALSGTSYAAIKIPAKSVGATQLKTGAVTAKKLRAGAITPAKLHSSTVAMFQPRGGSGGGFSHVVSRQVKVTGTQVARAVAACAPGGAISTSGYLGESMSNATNGGTPTEWRAIGVGGSTEEVAVLSEALCAS